MSLLKTNLHLHHNAVDPPPRSLCLSVKACKMFATPEMLLLSVSIGYTGEAVQVCVWGGVMK